VDDDELMAASVYGVVEAISVGVQQRWCCNESSPRFSAHGIGLSSRVCGALCGHDEHWCCARGVHCHKNGRRPNQGADGNLSLKSPS
jgi:hypothetical protein